MPVKPIVFVGGARDALRGFPEDARRRAGAQLYLLQQGLEPLDWKPMASIGPGVAELRIRTGRAFRIFYVARLREALYVLHAFEKKSQATAAPDVALGRARYAALLAARSTESS